MKSVMNLKLGGTALLVCLLAACGGGNLLTPNPQGPAASNMPTRAELDAWHQLVDPKVKPGCATIQYPEVEWTELKCLAPSEAPAPVAPPASMNRVPEHHLQLLNGF
jgi:hypothetical protein